MTLRVDSAGRLLLPKALRERAGLVPGAPVEVTVTEGRIEMKPAEAPIRLVHEGGLTVAVADADSPPLTEAEVTAIREELRTRRHH